MTLLLLILACETAQPLPPSAAPPRPPSAQMMKSGDVNGFLIGGSGENRAILLLVDHLDEDARAQSTTFTPATVLAITPTTETQAAQAYLSGLPGVEHVTIVCQRTECPETSLEGVRSTSPHRKDPETQDRPSER